ncbi:MAG: cyclase family protein [Deltaproteobacteria bacterium]|nr:cyclase family protein [Deltaproteobacteria bacterium]
MRLRFGDLDVDLSAARDLSIPVRFDDHEGRAFHLGPAHSKAVEAGGFVGDVRRGGSCNCETHTITPHADGTHTEGPGHLLGARVPVVVREPVCAAIVIRVIPRALGESVDDVAGNHRHDDLVIDRQLIEDAVDAVVVPAGVSCLGLVIASAAGALRRSQRHSGTNPPYLTPDAAELARARGFMHLLVDLPSIDREDDGGLLAAHRAFFDLPAGKLEALDVTTIAPRTVTELIAVDDDVAAGVYALFLMPAPFLADAAPSRPLIAALIASVRGPA